jgi:superfamily I DNA/RNA helicase
MPNMNGSQDGRQNAGKTVSAVLKYQTGSGASAQRLAALTYTSDDAYVGAGPGTGEGSPLVERYRFLRKSGVSGSKILALTISRRRSNSGSALRSRIRGLRPR